MAFDCRSFVHCEESIESHGIWFILYNLLVLSFEHTESFVIPSAGQIANRLTKRTKECRVHNFWLFFKKKACPREKRQNKVKGGFLLGIKVFSTIFTQQPFSSDVKVGSANAGMLLCCCIPGCMRNYCHFTASPIYHNWKKDSEHLVGFQGIFQEKSAYVITH